MGYQTEQRSRHYPLYVQFEFTNPPWPELKWSKEIAGALNGLRFPAQETSLKGVASPRTIGNTIIPESAIAHYRFLIPADALFEKVKASSPAAYQELCADLDQTARYVFSDTDVKVLSPIVRYADAVKEYLGKWIPRKKG